MGHVAQRFSFRISRGWALLILISGALIGAAFWIGPLRALPPELELLAIADTLAVPEVTLSGQVQPDGSVRFPLPLALRNSGTTPARPDRLDLSVPGQYRLLRDDETLQGSVNAGVPLRQYSIDLATPVLEPAHASVRVPGLDTLWIEPILPGYSCVLHEQIPEFVPAPQYDPASLSNVRIFYSFHIPERPRSAGLLTLHLDPAQLTSTPAPMPPVFPTEFEEPEATVPELGALREAGSRTAFCGDAELPVELHTALWETLAGGDFYVVYVNGAPRKHLYDLDGDGIIELETWDADGDERFEARREARFAVPEFLVPLPEDELLRPDSVPPDPAWLALFHNPRAGPFRFTRPPVDSLALADSLARADSLAVAGSGVVPVDSAVTGRAPVRGIAPEDVVPPADPAWLRLFNDTAAGPFRFTRGVPQPPRPGQPGQPDTDLPGQRPGAVDSAAAAADTVDEPPRTRPRRQPLGTPVPIPPIPPENRTQLEEQ